MSMIRTPLGTGISLGKFDVHNPDGSVDACRLVELPRSEDILLSDPRCITPGINGKTARFVFDEKFVEAAQV